MISHQNYTEFLSQTYKKVIEVCLEDQAIQTLKILDNKDYLFQRINELTSEIFVQEREQKIYQLTNRVKELEVKQNAPMGSQMGGECESCEVLHQQLFILEKEKRNMIKQMSDINEFEEKESKKIDIFMFQETQSLRKQLKNIENTLQNKTI